MRSRFENGSPALPPYVWITALVFAAVLLAFLLYTIVYPPPPQSQGGVLFVMALIGGFTAVFMGGAASLRFNWPAKGGGKLALSATGGLAAFFFLYIFPPYWWPKQPTPGGPLPPAPPWYLRPLSVSAGGIRTLPEVIKVVEATHPGLQIKIKNCGQSVMNAHLDVRTQLDGKNLIDLLKRLPNRTVEETEIVYDVKVVEKGVRYEIVCQ